MIETILFDLDGTLVDDGPNWRRSVSRTLDAVCSRHGGVDREQVQKTYYVVAGEVWDEIGAAEAPPWGNMDEGGIVRRVWAETLRRVGVGAPDTVEEAAAGYLAHRSAEAVPFADARECLERLKPLFKLGVITNAEAAVQVPKLESAGLRPYFAEIVTTDCGYGKPGAEIFHHALDRLGCPAARAVYVGDSLRWDIGGANGAGLLSVWITRKGERRGGADPVPAMEFESLAGLPAWLGNGACRQES